MDAVAVERQRRIAKEQHRRRMNLADPRVVIRRHSRYRRIRVGLLQIAIDNVVLIDEQRFRVAGYFVPNGNEHQRSGAPFLDVHIGDARFAPNRVADPQRSQERHPASGPHPARQGNRRQETAALRVPIGAGIGQRLHREEVQPMPGRR